jgi:5-formyltetrahydrofolate cyclo-ligase
LDESTRLKKGLLIQQMLIAADVFLQAGTLALYSPVNNEVETELLLKTAGAAGKRVCFPRVVSDTLEFRTVNTQAEMVFGAFGILEPNGGEALGSEDIDLLVVPGIAFDRNGYRLGYGKGFYDRKLALMSQEVVSAGLCYDFQLCDQLPVEAHDQPLDCLVTESGFIPCRKDASGSP